MKATYAYAIFLALFAACSAQADRVHEEMDKNLAKPIDCSSAAEDIKTLTSEHKRALREIEYGATSIVPNYAVAPEFTSDDKEKFAIDAGEYSQKLEAKIAAIKEQCGSE